MEKSDVPNEFTNEDGSFGQWEFESLEDGSQKLYTNKSAKNALVISLKEENVQENEAIELTRVGTGKDTRYAIKKLGLTETAAAKNEVKAEAVPF